MTTDPVTRPDYYGGPDDPFEPVKVIEAWGLGFHAGNAVKYLRRAGKKPGAAELHDLRKAAWYVNRLVEMAERDADAELPTLNDLHGAFAETGSAASPDSPEPGPPPYDPEYGVGDFVLYGDIRYAVRQIEPTPNGWRYHLDRRGYYAVAMEAELRAAPKDAPAAEPRSPAQPTPFKAGDRVLRRPRGVTAGTATEVKPEPIGVRVEWDNGSSCNYDPDALGPAPNPEPPPWPAPAPDGPPARAARFQVGDRVRTSLGPARVESVHHSPDRGHWYLVCLDGFRVGAYRYLESELSPA